MLTTWCRTSIAQPVEMAVLGEGRQAPQDFRRITIWFYSLKFYEIPIKFLRESDDS